ncbi:MAG: Ig-like domain-containing protein, partial [Phycisphaerales bacterium]
QQLATSVLNRRLSLAEVRSILTTTSVNVVDGDDEDDNVTNTGATFKRVDILALGERVLSLANTGGGQTTTPTGPNRKPTLSFVRTLVGAVAGRASTISYELLAQAANEADPDGNPLRFRIESVTASKGMLFKDGVRVVGKSTTLGPGETLTYVPGAKVSGTVNAFSIVASDGRLISNKAIAVNIKVAKSSTSAISSGLMPASASAVPDLGSAAPARVERIALSRPMSVSASSTAGPSIDLRGGVVLHADSVLESEAVRRAA